MTILHVADLHFDKRWFRWLAESAPRHDQLIISGDLLDLAHPCYPAEQARWVSQWLANHPAPVCVCSGNHDLEWDSQFERWLPAHWLRSVASSSVTTDGGRRVLDGVTVQCIGAGDRQASPAEIWVIHAPPCGVEVSRCSSGTDFGDPDFPVPTGGSRPRLVLCGHVHTPQAWNCVDSCIQYVNPGRNAHGRFPNHVIIDFEQETLIHVADHPAGPHCTAARLRLFQPSVLSRLSGLSATSQPLFA